MATDNPGSATAFTLNVRCVKCDSLFRSGAHDAKFYNAFTSKICGACGAHGFYATPERWVSASVWWNPLTWNKGYWEKKDDRH